MRPAAPLFVASLVVAAALASPACSSNSTASNGAADAGASGHALGTPCDPSVADPCETLTDGCSIAVCDPTTHVCVRVAVDAGPLCTGGLPPCSSPDCDGGGDARDGALEAATGSPDAGDAGPVADAFVADALGDADLDATIDAAIDAAADASDAGDE